LQSGWILILICTWIAVRMDPDLVDLPGLLPVLGRRSHPDILMITKIICLSFSSFFKFFLFSLISLADYLSILTLLCKLFSIIFSYFFK
jgi:hypothetical protein